jgi:hypothetical protein
MKVKHNNKKILWFSFLIIFCLVGIFLIYQIMEFNKNHPLRYHKLTPIRLESVQNLDKPLLNIENQQFFLEN